MEAGPSRFAAHVATYPAGNYGARAEAAVYPGAFHAWTVPTLGAPRFYAQYGSARKCPVILFGRGAPTVLVDGRAQPFDPDAFAACRAAGPGYSMAFDATTRTKSTADTVAFLQRYLRP